MGEECLDNLLETVERTRQQGVEPIRGHAIQTGGKGWTHESVVAGVDHHLVPEVPDVLDWIARLEVVIKGQSLELLQKLTLQD